MTNRACETLSKHHFFLAIGDKASTTTFGKVSWIVHDTLLPRPIKINEQHLLGIPLEHDVRGSQVSENGTCIV